ncbi:maltose O-acetyltransferase [Lachnospiraceae bacterium]|nr:maltose O-acetyltransferase [Lachnospiraceae bacterium]
MVLARLIVQIISIRKLKRVNHGLNTAIGFRTKLENPSNIYIGNNSYVNGGYLVAGKSSKIQIGDNCLISYEVHIRTKTHKYKNRNLLINQQGEYEKSIIIGDDCWIGFGVQIMPGIHIGTGSVVAAGAIVTHDTDPYGVYAGVPARKISERY